ncbi:MAG TPA: hypothetical protein VEU47_12860 [Candidatus Cybelea sp.]|nr:hypothetical protein [Candidatus Cybelea sp.]
MTVKPPDQSGARAPRPKSERAERRRRLDAALRDNLRRRKAQAKARAAQPDQREPDGTKPKSP